MVIHRLFGTTGYCAACNKVIPAFEMVMRAKSNVYHLECFACQQCNHRCVELLPKSLGKILFYISKLFCTAGFVLVIDFTFVTTKFYANTTTRSDWFSLIWPIIHRVWHTSVDKSAVYRYVRNVYNVIGTEIFNMF